MAALAIQTPSLAGAVITAAAAAGGGDTIEGTGDIVAIVTNGGVGSINVIITSTATVDGLGVDDGGGALAAGATKHYGPFKPGTFNNPTTGLVAITYSGVTSVTVSAMRVRY